MLQIAPAAQVAAGTRADAARAARARLASQRAKQQTEQSLDALKNKLRGLSYTSRGQDPRQLFAMYDRDNSGEIDLREFGNVIRKGGRLTAAQLSDAELERVFEAVRDGGKFPSVRGFAEKAPRGISIEPTWVRTYDGEFEKLDRLRSQVETGVLTLRVAETYLPERASEAHARLEAGGTRGRGVIEF